MKNEQPCDHLERSNFGIECAKGVSPDHMMTDRVHYDDIDARETKQSGARARSGFLGARQVSSELDSEPLLPAPGEVAQY